MRFAFILTILIVGFAASTKAASPTGWSSVILPTGDYRAHIKSIPIQQRPGRLLHVYGNTIRMIDQSSRGGVVRPMRQIFLGTTNLRTDGFGLR